MYSLLKLPCFSRPEAISLTERGDCFAAKARLAMTYS